MALIVLLNGPRGIGKDTLANIFRDKFSFFKTEFKHDLYQATADHYCIPVEVVRKRNETRALKELPWTYITEAGNTLELPPVRQMLIHVSEDIIKPTHGNKYFGKKAAERLDDVFLGNPEAEVVFSDSGFEEEMEAIKEAFPNCPVCIVRLEREGYKYTRHDSRKYLANPDVIRKLTEEQEDLDATAILNSIDLWLDTKGK